MKIIPKTQKDFEWVNWGPKDIEREVKKVVEKVKSDYEKIKAIPKKDRTFENTIYAFHQSGDVGYENKGIGFLQYVSAKKTVREASNKWSTWMWQQITGLSSDMGLYHAFKEYGPRKEKLSDEEKLLYKDAKIYFEEQGFHLDEKKRKELLKLKQKSTKLSAKFSKNISDYEDFILCTKEELAGLPESYIANLKKDSRTKKYKVTLAYPEQGPFMQFAENDKKRKELAIKISKKGGKGNLKILQELLLIRKEIAKILGYKTYAERVVKHRMSKNPEIIKKFLEDTISKLKPGVGQEHKELLRFAKRELGLPELTFYNQAYVSNKMRKHLFDYDANKVKEYFPMDRVMNYMFKLYGGLFGVSFQKSDLAMWHKDVFFFNVLEKNKKVGSIAFDLFPRQGKYSHMACWMYQGEAKSFRGDKRDAPLSIIVGNFPKSTKRNPSLLSMREIETMFHEFGHMMHGILTRTMLPSQASVDSDFVETPSQLFEEWVKDVDLLEDMSSHYKTGEKLPKDLKDKIEKSNEFMPASRYYGTFVMSLYDQLMHTTHYNKDVLDTLKKLEKKHSKIKSYEKSLFPAGWGHMAGYEASYYTYMWSLVYSYDIFSRFKKEGIRNKKVGKELREKILSKGGSVDEMEQLKDFLGRKPNNKAFLEALGIK